jgi:Dyp-type peroxidase family
VSRAVLEKDDIQGLLARGYGSLRFASFLLLAVADARAARATLATWADQLTTARHRPGEVAVNLALTAAGIEVLAPAVAQEAAFSEQFTTGMTTDYRSRLLGDTGDADPRGWAWGGPNSDPVHLLLLVYADSADRLSARCDDLIAQADAGGLRLVQQLPTSELTANENFGFHDGISQPQIEGFGERRNKGEVKAGEFVLGYPNEYGLLTDRPLLAPTADPQGLLPRDPGGSGRPDLGRNGSYLVLRTLRQDVEAFHAFTDTATRDAAGRSDPAQRALLAAKIVGRWPSGAPLVLAPGQDDPSLADSNDFGYAELDARGLACPLGSHVRRTNPRDSLEPRPGTEASLAINRRHRLLRRGRGYGSPTSGQECGVHFIALNANLARQYEFVQHTWVNNPVFNGLEDETDPLVGPRSSKRSYFTAPARPVRRRYAELPQFVHVRGGAYFFLPGIRALRFLSSAGSDTSTSGSTATG